MNVPTRRSPGNVKSEALGATGESGCAVANLFLWSDQAIAWREAILILEGTVVNRGFR